MDYDKSVWIPFTKEEEVELVISMQVFPKKYRVFRQDLREYEIYRSPPPQQSESLSQPEKNN